MTSSLLRCVFAHESVDRLTDQVGVAGTCLGSMPAVSDVELVRIGPEDWREFREVRLASTARRRAVHGRRAQ
jgi:hypothetical protein